MYLLVIWIEHLSWVFIKVHRCFCWALNIINDKGLLFKSVSRASPKVLLIILDISMGIWALSSATWMTLMSTVIIKLITEKQWVELFLILMSKMLQAVVFVIFVIFLLSNTDTV